MSKCAFVIVVAILATLASSKVAQAQNIDSTVAPNIDDSSNYVDIENTSGGDWYFFSSPTPSAASMSRISGLSEFVWPSVGNFGPDPDEEYNRIYPDEFLRVYPGSLAAGNTITIPFSYTPSGTRYDFLVTVTAGAQVTALNILDANPTAAASVQWGVSFSQAVSGVTAANFAFNNPDSISGLAITSVTADTAEPATNWTVTASTGTGTGILGLNWAGHVSETPTVPNSFVGEYYEFSVDPVITQYPASVGINVGTTTTMTVGVSLRGGGTPNYQWYSGSAADPGAATAISGATGSSYTPPDFTTVGSYTYFVEVYTTPGNYSDAGNAVITVVNPPKITSEPANTIVVSNAAATFTVTATGTSLTYQWYSGQSGDTSNPVGGGTASFTTPPLSANASYWVQIVNAGPTIASSGTVTARVITMLNPSVTSYGASVNQPVAGAFTITAEDSAESPVSNLPITFTAPTGTGATGLFAGNVSSATVNTSASGVATTPAFTANGTAGPYSVVANYSTLSVSLPITNYPVINTAAAATFPTDLSNSFAVAETGLTGPTFKSTGQLPSGVALSATGTLLGIPPSGSGGVYPITITAKTGSLPVATQDFTLTVVEKTNLIAHPGFNTNGVAWALNGDDVNGGPIIVNNVFQPTDGTTGENRSAWFRYPLYVGAFEASFIYQDVNLNGADGVAFVLQDNTNGTAALGLNGGGLGYCEMTTSVGLLMNLYSGSPGGASGIMLGTNGVGAYNLAGVSSGRSYQSTSPVNLDGGDPILVNVLYSNQVLNASFTDTATGNNFQAQFAVNIPAFVGSNAAYVGFTGSEGGVDSDQKISDFTFVPLPPVGAAPGANNAIVLSWPASVGGFVLQSNTNLDGTNWVTVSASITQTNNLNQATLSPGTGPIFYRLVLTP